eukprot:COSAG02_NODE_1629_length_11581_cov_5.858735_8_plen_40_part_00
MWVLGGRNPGVAFGAIYGAMMLLLPPCLHVIVLTRWVRG